MAQLKESMPAPPFESIDQDGNLVKMSDYKGKKIVQKHIRNRFSDYINKNQ